MIPETIIGEKERRFKIVEDPKGNPEELGRGTTGVVYKVQPEGAPDQPFLAAKVPFANLPDSTLADFRREVDIVKAIYRDAGQLKPVPAVQLGRDPLQPKLPILLLEYIDPAWHLSRSKQGEDKQKRLPEELGLKTGVQYAQLLVVLHDKAGCATNVDRKPDDLYWLPEPGRLVVLDWNRASALPPDPDRQQQSKEQDIRIFAQLWAELLLGHAVYSLPDPADESDAAWQSLSLGTRVILEKARSNRPWYAYTRAADLQQDLEVHLVRWGTAAQAPAELAIEGMRLQKQAAAERSATARSDRAQQIKIIADLILRRAPAADAAERAHAAELSEAADKLLEQSRLAFNEKIAEVRSQIGAGQYRRARDLAQRELDEIHGQSPEEARARLALRQWLTLGKLAAVWVDAGQDDLAEPVNGIAKGIAGLQEPGLNSDVSGGLARHALDQLSKIPGIIEDGVSKLGRVTPETLNKSKAILQPIQSEVVIRQQCLNAGVNHDKPELLAQSLDAALREWNALQSVEPSHAGDLRLVLRRLAEYEATKTRDRVEEQSREAVLARFTAQADEIFRDLTASSIESDHYINRVNEALKLYRRDLAGEDVRGSLDLEEDYNMLFVIRTYSAEMKEDAGEVLRRALQLQVRRERGETVRKPLVKICVQKTVEQLQELIDQMDHKEGSLWPDELRRGLRWFSALSQVEGQNISMPPEWPALRDSAQVKLADKKGQLDRLLQDIPSNPQSKLEDALPDEVLARAREQGLEILERDRQSPDKEATRRVRYIIATRGAAGIQKQVDALSVKLQGLAQGIQHDSQELSEAIVKIQPTLAEFDKLADPAEVQSRLDKKPELERAATQLKESMAHLTQAEKESAAELTASVEKSELAKKRLADADTLLNQIKEKLGEWHDALEDIDKARDQIEQISNATTGPRAEQAREAVIDLPTLNDILFSACLAEGLAAVKELNLPIAQGKLKDLAEMLPQADKRKGSKKASTEKYALLEKLNQAVEWLSKITHASGRLFGALNEWNKSVNNGSLDEAEQRRKELRSIRGDAEFWSYWVIADLDQRHLQLLRATRQVEAKAQADAANARREFVEKAREILVQEHDLDKLEKHIYNDNIFGSVDGDTISTWAEHLKEARWIQELLGEFSGEFGKKGRSLKRTIDLLLDVFYMVSDQVFVRFFDDWNEGMKKQKDALRQFEMDNQEKEKLIESIDALARSGKMKKERGSQLLHLPIR